MRLRPTRRPLLSSALLFLAAAGSAGAASVDPPEEQGGDARDAWVLPDQMGAIYQEHCAVCHGASLEGAAQGPNLLVDLKHGDSVGEVTASIARGFPELNMPRWAETLPAEDIRGLAIYLLEKRTEAPMDVRNGTGAPPTIPTDPVASALHSFVLKPVIGGIDEPYSIAPLPDGRILVTEKMRGISIVAADGSSSTRVTGTPRFYDDSKLRGSTYAGSGWAHEVALHPDYAENGWIYLSYGDRCEGCNAASREAGAPATMLKLVRGRLKGSEWVDQQTIWQAPKDTYQVGLENGAGARIAFDDEGYVYLTIGAFSDYRGIQDLDKPQGKIHRVHDDGRVPEDNPFVEVAGALASTYTLGHRNPQGIAFDATRRVMWSSEHGPRGGDEGNIVRAGANYGWPLVSLGVDYDGRPIRYAQEYGIEFDPADLTPATIDWTPSPGVSSIVFYRGDAFPQWRDQMIVATLGGNDLWRVVVDENGALHSETLLQDLGRFRDVEVGPSGELVVLLEHRAGSQIVRIEPAGH
jgi:glucose/arabinose dehydrogenase